MIALNGGESWYCPRCNHAHGQDESCPNRDERHDGTDETCPKEVR